MKKALLLSLALAASLGLNAQELVLMKGDKEVKRFNASEISHVEIVATPPKTLPELDKSSPVGTIGIVGGREAIKVSADMAVATRNVVKIYGQQPSYTETGSITDVGTPLSRAEAMEASERGAFGKGWYVPAYDEFYDVLQLNDKIQWNGLRCGWELAYGGGWLFFPSTDGGKEGAYSTSEASVFGAGKALVFKGAGDGCSYDADYYTGEVCVRPFYKFADAPASAGIPGKGDGVLINGVLWSPRNVGAEAYVGQDPESAFGTYFAFGETAGKDAYDAGSYSYSGGSLDLDHDAAYAAWKKGADGAANKWRMPTYEEIQSLLDPAKVQADTVTIGGVRCMRFTDKAVTSNSICLPLAGYRNEEGGVGVGEYGMYWTSTRDGNYAIAEQAYSMQLEYEKQACSSYVYGGYAGMNIRPVWDDALPGGDPTPPAPVTTGTAKRTGDIDVNWVQLWENGPKFAEYNVGAENNKAEGYGGYYCWGKTADKDPNGAYNQGTEPLSGDDDTATKLWGSKWRMPTDAELRALLDNCEVVWTEDYNNDGTNITGGIFTGKGAYSSNSVFLPAAGYCWGGNVTNKGSNGCCWSSTPDGSAHAFALGFISGNQEVDYGDRYFGCSVRAVLDERPTVSFDLGGKGTMAPVKVESGAKISKPGDPTADGFEFKGWYKEKEWINAWDFDNDLVTSDTTLYAKWEGTTGTATTKDGAEVKWVQLWAGGPKFAEYNVGATSATEKGTEMTFTDAVKEGADYAWGDNWRTPSLDEINELCKAASSGQSDKVTCTYTAESGVYGFKFTGKETGYTSNSVSFPVPYCDGYSDASYWSATANGSGAWIMCLYYFFGEWSCSLSSGHLDDKLLVRPVLKN